MHVIDMGHYVCGGVTCVHAPETRGEFKAVQFLGTGDRRAESRENWLDVTARGYGIPRCMPLVSTSCN